MKGNLDMYLNLIAIGFLILTAVAGLLSYTSISAVDALYRLVSNGTLPTYEHDRVQDTVLWHSKLTFWSAVALWTVVAAIGVATFFLAGDYLNTEKGDFGAFMTIYFKYGMPVFIVAVMVFTLLLPLIRRYKKYGSLTLTIPRDLRLDRQD